MVAKDVAQEFLPQLIEIYARKGVEIRGCAQTLEIIGSITGVAGVKAKLATEQDWYEEYLAPIISVKVVAGLDEAIAHINKYSSHHTDAILTETYSNAEQF